MNVSVISEGGSVSVDGTGGQTVIRFVPDAALSVSATPGRVLLEFSEPVVIRIKPAGLLSRLGHHLRQFRATHD